MKLNFKIILFILSISSSMAANSLAERDYPKTKQEREVDSMGSILGGEGVIFKPGKVKNETTKTQLGFSINKYLWQAAIETLNFAPLGSIDSNSGVIITDWYSPKNKPGFSFKINIFIRDNVISPEAIEVKLFQRVLKNNSWQPVDQPSNLPTILEDKILRRARELYIKSERE
jgi:hypothetical protein